MELQPLLEKSSLNHSHLCPRQILGIRIGLAGLLSLGFESPPEKKRILLISETDGCFVDGVSAATNCTVGHRTMRIEDYGKTAVTFVDTVAEQAIRVAPQLNLRSKAAFYMPEEPRHYFAQMEAYKVMPDSEMFNITPVILCRSITEIVSRPGLRVNCGYCGEEIMNEREILIDGLTLCWSCAHGGYFQPNMIEMKFPQSVRR